jgi:RNA polymerase sigma-70 factor, ECF subfamily
MQTIKEREEEKKLIEEAKNNPEAFQELYKKHHKKVYNYFLYRTGHDKDTSADLTQETFIRAFSKIGTYEERGYAYTTYLLRIAHNSYLNFLREKKEESLDGLEELPIETIKDIETQYDLETIWKDIMQLPLMEREVVLLRFRRDMSIRGIAAVIDKSENATKLILSRARKKLKAHKDLSPVRMLPSVAPSKKAILPTEPNAK